MFIYLDANPAIYTVEQVAPYAAAVDARLAAPGVVKVVSYLTRMECLVKTLRLNDPALLRDYSRFFAACRHVRLTNAVYDKAAEIRARHTSFKALDALHLAAAVAYNCGAFLTNDRKLGAFTGIPVEII